MKYLVTWCLTLLLNGVVVQCIITEITNEVYRLQDAFEILPVNNKTLFNQLGMAPTARQCGGPGKFVKWRHESCLATLEGPCIIKANEYVRGEVIFIPSRDSVSLGAISEIKDVLRGAKELAKFKNAEIPNSYVEAGKEYALSAVPSTTSELQGKLITARITIYHEDDRHVELCAETEFLVS